MLGQYCILCSLWILLVSYLGTSPVLLQIVVDVAITSHHVARSMLLPPNHRYQLREKV